MKKRFPWHRIDPNLPPAEYDASAVEKIKSRCKVMENGCWEFQGTRNELGYGQFIYRGKSVPTHRIMHILVNGPIPDDYDCCHICDNPPCCNPAHTFPDTHQNNILQSVEHGRHHKVVLTHCKRGHEFTADNTYISPDGWRHCKICERAKQRMYVGWPEDLAYSAPKGYRGEVPAALVRGAPLKTKPHANRTHCPRGHELVGDNLYITPKGYRQCRPCRTASVYRFAANLTQADGEVGK